MFIIPQRHVPVLYLLQEHKRARPAMHGYRNIEELSRNFCCRRKKKYITYSEFVSIALVIQYIMRMRRIILSSVACPAVTYFFTPSHKPNVFRGKRY
jgi:hypothetical protein